MIPPVKILHMNVWRKSGYFTILCHSEIHYQTKLLYYHVVHIYRHNLFHYTITKPSDKYITTQSIAIRHYIHPYHLNNQMFLPFLITESRWREWRDKAGALRRERHAVQALWVDRLSVPVQLRLQALVSGLREQGRQTRPLRSTATVQGRVSGQF